jgi:hypothetical protein
MFQIIHDLSLIGWNILEEGGVDEFRCGRPLTDFIVLKWMDQRGQVEISGDDGHLVRRLIREIEGFAVGSAKQQKPGTGLLIVNGADVQRRVARRILGVHVGSVEEQILQMLDQSIAARLCHKSRYHPERRMLEPKKKRGKCPYLVHFVPALSVLNAQRGIVVQQSLTQHGRTFVQNGVVERSQALAVSDSRRSAQIQQRPHGFNVVLLSGSVQGRRSATRPVIEQSSAAHQGQEKRTGTRGNGRHRQRSFWIYGAQSGAQCPQGKKGKKQREREMLKCKNEWPLEVSALLPPVSWQWKLGSRPLAQLLVNFSACPAAT